MAHRILCVLVALAAFASEACAQEEPGATPIVAKSPAGIEVTGTSATVEGWSGLRCLIESRGLARPRLAFSVNGLGPTPLHVRVPIPATASFELYRRLSPGTWLRVDNGLAYTDGWLAFEASGPGSYAVTTGAPPAKKGQQPLFSLPEPLSDQPEAKAKWQLARVDADHISGSVPLILVHGLEGGNWSEFLHWAAHSREAEAFRATFQVWEYSHPTTGVNAAVGFSSAYPAFSESIVAYLTRFLDGATNDGVETDGVRYFFPPTGPICMLAHSFGGMKALAFLRNAPVYAERVKGVVALSPTMLGTPGATPQWLRHTVSRLRLANGPTANLVLQGLLADVGLMLFMDERKQSDLDGGWVNTDAQGGFGVPVRTFAAWRWGWGFEQVVLSPRDANATDARDLPGYQDGSFEPAAPLATYCGGLDEILPTERGDRELGKFFIYAAYLDRTPDWAKSAKDASKELMAAGDIQLQNSFLLFTNALMATVATPGSDVPLGAYALNDGLVPLQSQLLLDGRQTELLYETKLVNGWRVPVVPFRPRSEVIRVHTLAEPGRLRVLKNWTHLDTLTGKYDVQTEHSALFSAAATDLLSAVDGGN